MLNAVSAPLVGELMTVDANVDGGGVIDERNDSNNEREATITLTLPEETETEDVESGVSTTTIYIGSLIAGSYCYGFHNVRSC